MFWTQHPVQVSDFDTIEILKNDKQRPNARLSNGVPTWGTCTATWQIEPGMSDSETFTFPAKYGNSQGT